MIKFVPKTPKDVSKNLEDSSAAKRDSLREQNEKKRMKQYDNLKEEDC